LPPKLYQDEQSAFTRRNSDRYRTEVPF